MIEVPAVRASAVGEGPLATRARLLPGVVLLAWVVSRLVAGLSLVIVDWVDSKHVRWDALVDWDAGWYLDIARNGYPHKPLPADWSVAPEASWPFFPLAPGIVRGLAELGISDRHAIVVLNNVAFLVALAGLHRLAARHLGSHGAWWAVWVVALLPGSITSVMGYTGGLFLAGTVWAFVLVEQDRALAAGIAMLFATASRPNGALVLLALVPAVITPHLPAAESWVTGWRRAVGGSWRGALAVSVPSIAFVAAWSAWLHARSGDALVFLHSKAAWHETSIIGFVRDPSGQAVVHLALGAAAIVALIANRRRLPIPWYVLAVVCLAPPLVLGVVGLGRYAAECFPVVIAIAVLVMNAPRWMRAAYLCASAASLVVMAILVRHSRVTP